MKSRLPEDVAQRAFEAMDAAMVLMTAEEADRSIIYVNPAFERLTGYPAAEVVDRDPAFLWGEDRTQDGPEQIRKALAQQRSVVAVLLSSRKDGSPFWNEVRIAPLRDTGGRVTHWIAVHNDVTGRHEHERQEAEERFRLVADAAPVMIWMSDSARRCDYVNKAWLEFTGRSMEQEMGEGWKESLHGEDRQSYLAAYSAAFDRHTPYRMEYRLRRRDGAYRWILETGVPRFAEDRSLAGYIGSCLDITDRIEMERALRASEARFRSIAEHSYDWESWIGPHNKPLWINPAVERMTGYSVEECMAMRNYPLPLVHPEDRQRLVRELKQLRGNNLPFRIVRKDRSIRRAAISWQAITDVGGDFSGLRTSVREA